MMDTDPAQVDDSLHEGLDANRFLTLGAVVGAVGWAVTQYVAWNPGFALETVGLEGTTALVLFWAGATALLATVWVGAASRAVTFSPPMWLWALLVTVALGINAVAVLGVLPRAFLLYAFWHPWILVFAFGFLATGVLVTHRNRTAYLLGSLGAALLVLVAVLFPRESGDWLFLLTGVVHAGPLLADAASSPPGGASDSSNERRDSSDSNDATETAPEL
jgi:hypothetical protein